VRPEVHGGVHDADQRQVGPGAVDGPGHDELLARRDERDVDAAHRRDLVLRSGGSLMIGRAKIEHGKDAGSPDIDDIGATEDTARRRFAAARARETFGTEH